MAPATELTCTWADHLRQCSRFHHSCIDMQGALGQVAQWLQEQKPGKHTINNTNNITHITKPRRSSQAHVERGFMNAKWDAAKHKCAGGWCTQADVYLRRTYWSQSPPERSLLGRHRCIHQVGGDTGGCTHSYKGSTLKRKKQTTLLDTV